MIIDANLATYWFVDTPFTAAAIKFRRKSPLFAPNFVRVEVASALLRYHKAGILEVSQMNINLEKLDGLISAYYDDNSLIPTATEISAANNHPVYDCLYLALALQQNDILITADKRLASLATKLSIKTQLIKPTP
jgi:predicted nucleic acid-binding protein